MTQVARRALEDHGAVVESATAETYETVRRFEQEVFPDWYFEVKRVEESRREGPWTQTEEE